MLPNSVTVQLDRTSDRTLPAQLADRLRAAITDGEIPPGTRLPSTRTLASQLCVARAVIEGAYEQLGVEGWLDAIRGSGTYVRLLPHMKPVVPQHDRGTTIATGNEVARTRLASGTPWVPERTSAAWKRAWRDVAFTALPSTYPDPRGDRDLRAAVARLLGRVRGLHVSPESVIITAGSMHGMGLGLAALRTHRHGAVPVLAHENPGYRVATTTAHRSGWSVVDTDVDADGMVTASLASTPPETGAVYVTPSHQYPTGGLLPIGRRRALAEFARLRDAMIIEDDYDSEFRYGVAPLPTIAELAPDHTIYLGTVAKTLGAGIRLGWLVAPTDVVERIVTLRIDTGDYPSVPVQHAMLTLLRDGEWDRTVRAARRTYRLRDRLVADALAPFGELRGVGAGMYTTLLLDPGTAAAVAVHAAAKGVEVETLERSTRGKSDVGGLMVGYGAVSDEELTLCLDVLTAALRAVS